MRVTNQFLDQAIAGLQKKEIWITSGLEIRGKDYSPVRVVKAWAKYLVPFIYSDIQSDEVWQALRKASWAGVDVQKAQKFLKLFGEATQKPFVPGLAPVRQEMPKIEKKIEADTFLANWAKQQDGLQILKDIPRIRIDVIVSERDYFVHSDISGCVSVYDAHQGRLQASVTHFQDGNVTAFFGNPFDANIFNANTLQEILLKAHARPADGGHAGRLTAEQKRQLTDLMQAIHFIIQHPAQPLPFSGETVEFEGFTYKPEICLRSAAATDFYGGDVEFGADNGPSVEFVGKKEGRADKRIAIYLAARTAEIKKNADGEPATTMRNIYVLKTTFFESNVGAFISAFHQRCIAQKKPW
jgi:hypothetical protein